MKFSEIANRLTGISTPIFGVSWQPSELELAAARRIVSFLEDRRVLYSPNELEVPAHCVDSILQIRLFLTSEIGKLDSKSEFTASLRAMRAACRKFLDAVGAEDRYIILHATENGHYASWTFYSALGELRGTFGIHLARIAGHFRLDVEDDLASILPAKAESGSDTSFQDQDDHGGKHEKGPKNVQKKKRGGYESYPAILLPQF
jgi:hypothetical protein